MKDLNLDIIENILNYTNINEVVKTCLHLNRSLLQTEVDWLVCTRKDPKYIFDQVFQDSRGILEIIEKSGSCLSGVRAINYFKPLSINQGDPWIFYCQNHPLSYLRMLAYLQCIGVVFRNSVITGLFNGSVVPMNSIKGYKEYKGKQWNISVCWPVSTSKDIFCTFPRFNKVSTPSYVAIFGNAAVAPYARELFNSQGYVWMDTAREVLNAESQKYGYLRNGTVVSEWMDFVPVEYDDLGIKLIDKGKIDLTELESSLYGKQSYTIKFINYRTPQQMIGTSTNIHFEEYRSNNMILNKLESSMYAKILDFTRQHNIINLAIALQPYIMGIYKAYEVPFPTYLDSALWHSIIIQVVNNDSLWVTL